jgi:predicted nuclease of predicted toxin-antitoxin system
MHIKIDEDLPYAVLKVLESYGYNASTVYKQGMGGWKDPELWSAIQSQQCFLITGDKGFGDIRKYPPGSHHGVLVLRPSSPNTVNFVRLLDLVLRAVRLEDLHGCIAIATA